MNKEKPNSKRILLSVLISILAYRLYVLISVSLSFLLTSGIYEGVNGMVRTVLAEGISYYIVGVLILKFHQKTKGEFVGYLESTFLALTVLACIFLKMYLMIIFWLLAMLASIIYKKEKTTKQTNIALIFSTLIIITIYSVYSNIFIVVFFIKDTIFAVMFTGILFTVCFSVIEYVTKGRYRKNFLAVYAVMGCVKAIAFSMRASENLINYYETHGREVFLYYLEKETDIATYLSCGVAFLLGELIALTIHKVDESDKKIAEKRLVESQKENVNR